MKGIEEEARELVEGWLEKQNLHGFDDHEGVHVDEANDLIARLMPLVERAREYEEKWPDWQRLIAAGNAQVLALRERAERAEAQMIRWEHDLSEQVERRTKAEAEVERMRAELRQSREPLQETYACDVCGRRDGLDAVLADRLWEQLRGEANIICLWCLDANAAACGVDAPVVLHFAGRGLYGGTPDPWQWRFFHFGAQIELVAANYDCEHWEANSEEAVRRKAVSQQWTRQIKAERDAARAKVARLEAALEQTIGISYRDFGAGERLTAMRDTAREALAALDAESKERE